jgi:hypothetical protein
MLRLYILTLENSGTRSTSITSWPAFLNPMAVATPPIPAPTMITRYGSLDFDKGQDGIAGQPGDCKVAMVFL